MNDDNEFRKKTEHKENLISRYLNDQNQVLKLSSLVVVQERKNMKIELISEGIRMVKWYSEE